MVESVDFDSGLAKIKILLTISGCPMRDKLKSDVSSAVTKVAGVEKVELEFGTETRGELIYTKDRLIHNGKIWEASLAYNIKENAKYY